MRYILAYVAVACLIACAVIIGTGWGRIHHEPEIKAKHLPGGVTCYYTDHDQHVEGFHCIRDAAK